MKTLLKNKKGLTTIGGVVIIVAMLLIGGLAYAFLASTPKTNILLQGTTPTQAPVAGMSNVDKPLKLNFANIYGGGALTGTTSAVQVYLDDGVTKSGAALTIASSSTTTALAYPSGTQLVVGYAYSTTDYMFWNIVVPQMNSADAQS